MHTVVPVVEAPHVVLAVDPNGNATAVVVASVLKPPLVTNGELKPLNPIVA